MMHRTPFCHTGLRVIVLTGSVGLCLFNKFRDLQDPASLNLHRSSR